MTQSEPLIRLTVADSDAAHSRFLAGLNRPEDGVLSLRARPTTRRNGWMSKDLLAAMGKRFDVSGKLRNDQEYTALVPVWLAAHDISDVVISGVETLLLDHLHHLALLAHGSGVRLWLVADHVASAALHELAAAWPMFGMSRRDFDAHWSALPEQPETAEGLAGLGQDWPAEVPYVDFPVFLSEARSRLAPDEAEAVASGFLKAFEETHRILEAGDDEVLDEDTVADMLRTLLRDCTTRPEMVTCVRAFQTAAFVDRWLVLVDLDTFLSSGSDHLAALAANPETWRSLRAYTQPYRAAACALVAAGADLDSLESLRLADLLDNRLGTDLALDRLPAPGDADAACSSNGGSADGLDLPRGSEVFVRALVLQRLAGGATADDNVFYDGSDQVGPRTLGRALDAAATELGLVFSTGPVRRKTETPKQWRQRHGVSVQHIDPPKRRSSG